MGVLVKYYCDVLFFMAPDAKRWDHTGLAVLCLSFLNERTNARFSAPNRRAKMWDLLNGWRCL